MLNIRIRNLPPGPGTTNLLKNDPQTPRFPITCDNGANYCIQDNAEVYVDKEHTFGRSYDKIKIEIT
jgi:hypothetical protein